MLKLKYQLDKKIKIGNNLYQLTTKRGKSLDPDLDTKMTVFVYGNETESVAVYLFQNSPFEDDHFSKIVQAFKKSNWNPSADKNIDKIKYFNIDEKNLDLFEIRGSKFRYRFKDDLEKVSYFSVGSERIRSNIKKYAFLLAESSESRGTRLNEQEKKVKIGEFSGFQKIISYMDNGIKKHIMSCVIEIDTEYIIVFYVKAIGEHADLYLRKSQHAMQSFKFIPDLFIESKEKRLEMIDSIMKIKK
ncbi:MAG: hypothetical protein MJB14_14250 [Spirochaetes bacterium]|nr:hypothetical protein [Spirochaetota bacterium]